ncbi:JmjC domain-containing histone demethylation protein 1 [Venturia nashicola]|uniref:JmjC domain-containing histone demethylation protein 1 n=1 Tax=Venturia nashicola TaxID=86259 RepID=A0A4Z1P199_9PEZI|nr:JmjC domain-containing histone demethylation protein 1 [Venturia nashicola]TLD35214.1 JmjC domain-containing histone demethylation protein 1 [Venturia nashicola]
MPNQSASTAFSRLYDALTHGPGLYPLKGVIYFLAHPFLYPLLRAKLLPCALLSIFVLTNLFLFTYLPQVAFLAIWQGRSAWFNGTILVLGEGAAIVGLLFEAFFVDETQVDTFDSVLLNKGYEDLIAGNRPVNPDEEGQLDALKRLGKPLRKAQYAPFSFRQILEFVVFLPLNFVPIVGVPLFLALTGYRAGPLLMWRYFALRGFTKKERNAYIKRRKWSYAWFGTIHLVLQLIPVLNMFFLITTAAGSGLYAADEEARRVEEIESQHQAENQYTDDPL